MVSTAYKIHAAVLNEHLKKDIEEKNIPPDIQAGFRKSRSTIDNMYMLQHIIERETAKPRGKVFTFFVDLEAAFDKVARTNCGEPWKEGGQQRDNRKNKGNVRVD